MLKQFGETRSMVVAPTSASDLDRAQRIGAMGKLVDDQATDARGQQELRAQQAQVIAITRPAECHHCGATLDDDARFCGDCGLPVTTPA